MLRGHEQALSQVVDAYTRDVERHVPIHPEYVARSRSTSWPPTTPSFTVDTGMCNVWAARYMTPNGRRRVIGSFRHGIDGQRAAARHRRAVRHARPAGDLDVRRRRAGDAARRAAHRGRARLPVKIVLFNNASLGMVKLEMLVDGIPTFETDHGAADLAAIARAAGIPGAAVETPPSWPRPCTPPCTPPAPTCWTCVTDPNALSIPPHITAEQVRGFALAATRTVLDGGVGKMLELAQSNLRNIPRPHRS